MFVSTYKLSLHLMAIAIQNLDKLESIKERCPCFVDDKAMRLAR